MRVNELREDFERGAKIVKEKRYDSYLGSNNACLLGTIVVGAVSRETGLKSYKKIKEAFLEARGSIQSGSVISALSNTYDVGIGYLHQAEHAFEHEGLSRRKALEKFFPAEEEAPADEPEEDEEEEGAEEVEELVEV